MTKNEISVTLEDMNEHHIYLNTMIKITIEGLEDTGKTITPLDIEKVERILDAEEARHSEMEKDIAKLKKAVAHYKKEHSES